MYSLRPATPDDHDFLYALNRTTLREYVEPIWGWHEEWQEEYFRKKFDPPKRQVIQVDGRDAGVLVVERHPDEVYLGLIELLPEFQRRGIGAAIINRLKAEAHANKLPLTLHVLRTNTPARRLYERLGFQVVAEEEYRYRMSCPPGGAASGETE
jgi:ribosomal protein S18 acetylase RimI-like enzyme